MSRRGTKRTRAMAQSHSHEEEEEDDHAASTSEEDSPSKHPADDTGEGWECTVCTYRNRLGAFKCAMCDSRKGTSTRKPRMATASNTANTSAESLAVQQQAAAMKVVEQTRHKLEKRNTLMARLSSASPPMTHPTTGRPMVRVKRDTMSTSRDVDERSDTTPLSEAPSSSKPNSQVTTPKIMGAPRPRRGRRAASGSTAPHPAPGRRSTRAKRSVLLNRIVDANSARTMTVTCGGVTVAITDYKPLDVK